MELRQLRYFVAVADAGTLTRAAAELYLAPSSVSQQLSALERELGVTLLTRGPSGMTLTASGREFYRHAQALLVSADTAKAAVTSHGDHPSAPRLRVGLLDWPAHAHLFSDAIASFRVDHPDVLLEFPGYDYSPPERLGAGYDVFCLPLMTGLIDIGVGLSVDSASYPAELRSLRLADLDLTNVLLPIDDRLTKRDSITLLDLHDHPLFLPHRVLLPRLREQFVAEASRAGLAPRPAADHPTLASAVAGVAAGGGGMFVSDAFASSSPPAVVVLPVTDLHLPLHIDVLWHVDNLNPAIDAFLAHLRKS